MKGEREGGKEIEAGITGAERGAGRKEGMN